MSINNKILNERKNFYEPYSEGVKRNPGSPRVPPISKAVSKTADYLNGKIMTLKEAILRLQASAKDEEVRLIESHNFIVLIVRPLIGKMLMYRLVRYKDVKKNPHR